MHRDSIIVVGADAGALARLVERMNARPGGFALNLSGGSRRSGSTGSWPPTGTVLNRPMVGGGQCATCTLTTSASHGQC
jgi:hypothetical protein